MKQILASIGIIFFLLVITVRQSYADILDIVPNFSSSQTANQTTADDTPKEEPTPSEPSPTITPQPTTSPTPTTSPVTPTPTHVSPTPTPHISVTPTPTPTQAPGTITPTPTTAPKNEPTATPTPQPSSTSTTDSKTTPPTSGLVQAATAIEKVLGISTKKSNKTEADNETLANKVITAPIDLISKQFSKEYYADQSLSKQTSQRLLFLSFLFMVVGVFLVQPTLRRRVMKQLHKLPKEGVIFTRFRYLTSLFF